MAEAVGRARRPARVARAAGWRSDAARSDLRESDSGPSSVLRYPPEVGNHQRTSPANAGTPAAAVLFESFAFAGSSALRERTIPADGRRTRIRPPLSNDLPRFAGLHWRPSAHGG